MISLGFTTYNSADFIERQIQKDYFSMSKGLISEIVIQDDHTEDYQKLQHLVSTKIKLHQNKEHLSPLLSRPNLVSNSKNDWVLIMDSDNFLNSENFFIIRNILLQEDTIYCPAFAKPNFDFRKYNGKFIDINFAQKEFNDLSMQIFLNTGNYLVNKKKYLEVSKKIETKYNKFTVDVIYYNYLWLSEGYKLFCMENYEYDHTLRGDSYWQTTHSISGDVLNEVNSKYINHGSI